MSEITGKDGVPLRYIISYNDFVNLTPNKDFFDYYVNNTSLQGESFTTDASEVLTFIVNIISQNEDYESVIKIHKEERNERKDWKYLKYHYEGIWVYSNYILKTELDLKNLTYTGENKPTMWWTTFERRLSLAYQTYVKHEVREVHSDQISIRVMLEKVTCNSIGKIKSSIKVWL